MATCSEKVLFVLLLSPMCCAANGLSDSLVPFIAQPVNIFNRALVRNPIVQHLSDWTGDAVAFGGRAISDLPLALSRIIGKRGIFPKLLDKNVASDFQENFLEQFNAGKDNEDAYLHITELVTKYGYPIDMHTVQTSDDYVLTIYRIRKDENAGKKAVLLMHGLLGSSDDWVIAGPSQSLAYLLADRGYDVWLGNARGNAHSRRHATLSPSSSRFWNFSWHEVGVYDLPAIIDYILSTTKQKSLKYVGHSQGTTSFFVMCSELPEYNRYIELMVALSPVAWMSNIASPVIRLMAPGGDFIQAVLSNVGVNEFLPSHSILKTIGRLFCAENALSQILCSNVLFLTCGFSLEQLNTTTLPIILGHLPSGASVKQLLHYGQGIISGDFSKYDFGKQQNIETYGTATAPNYRVDQVTAPVSLFYSVKDWLASPEDVGRLRSALGNVVDVYRVPREQFNHIDFLWGMDAKTLVFDRVLALMEKF